MELTIALALAILGSVISVSGFVLSRKDKSNKDIKEEKKCKTTSNKRVLVRRNKMFDEIILKVILTVVGFITTGVLGYFVAKIKNYKKRDTNQEEALKCLLRSNITSKYYVYNELKEIPLYEKENINYMYEQYKSMNGNSYVGELVEELNNLPIKR